MAAYASIDDDRSRRRRTAGGVALVGMGAAAALVGSRGFALRRGASQTRLSVRSMTISNGYERDQGRAIGDGQYPFAYLADVAQSTRLAMDDGIACSWAVDGIAIDGGAAATSVEVNLTAVGDHFVTADCGADVAASYNFSVVSRVVRRELRELSAAERDAYFGALFSLYLFAGVDVDVTMNPKMSDVKREISLRRRDLVSR